MIEISGTDAVLRRLAADLRPAIETGAMGIAAALQDIIAPYPPAPPRSRYRRTGQLGQGWRIRGIPLGAVLENRTGYAGPVQGPDQRATFRRIGWRNTDQAIQQVVGTGRARRIMEDAIDAKLR